MLKMKDDMMYCKRKINVKYGMVFESVDCITINRSKIKLRCQKYKL